MFNCSLTGRTKLPPKIREQKYHTPLVSMRTKMKGTHVWIPGTLRADTDLGVDLRRLNVEPTDWELAPYWRRGVPGVSRTHCAQAADKPIHSLWYLPHPHTAIISIFRGNFVRLVGEQLNFRVCTFHQTGCLNSNPKKLLLSSVIPIKTEDDANFCIYTGHLLQLVRQIKRLLDSGISESNNSFVPPHSKVYF